MGTYDIWYDIKVRRQFVQSDLSFYLYLGSGSQIQVPVFLDKNFYLFHHLTRSKDVCFYKEAKTKHNLIHRAKATEHVVRKQPSAALHQTPTLPETW